MSMLDEIVQLDDAGRLFLSAAILDWNPLHERKITAVIDLEGGLDLNVPTTANHVLYIYFPIVDGTMPDLEKLHAVARLGADLVRRGQGVLSHCGMGLNRSALVAGLILMELGMRGEEAVRLLRARRPGALYNERFAEYLLGHVPGA
jgi:protein-tyrosine phosphatase